MQQITVEQAFRESCTMLGEAVVRERIQGQALAAAMHELKDLKEKAAPATKRSAGKNRGEAAK